MVKQSEWESPSENKEILTLSSSEESGEVLLWDLDKLDGCQVASKSKLERDRLRKELEESSKTAPQEILIQPIDLIEPMRPNESKPQIPSTSSNKLSEIHSLPVNALAGSQDAGVSTGVKRMPPKRPFEKISNKSPKVQETRLLHPTMCSISSKSLSSMSSEEKDPGVSSDSWAERKRILMQEITDAEDVPPDLPPMDFKPLDNINLAEKLLEDYNSNGPQVTVEDLINVVDRQELENIQELANAKCHVMISEFKSKISPADPKYLTDTVSIKKKENAGSYPPWFHFLVETHQVGIAIDDKEKRQEQLMDYMARQSFFGRLHEEVLGLLGWLEPTECELELRKRSFARIKHVISQLWPMAMVGAFGSSNNGLVLPTGDIDICILDVPGDPKTNLKLLGLHLTHWRLVRCMEVITKAKVPIIKAIDAVTDYSLDITISQPSSFETTDYVKRSLDQYCNLRPLLMILKLYLQQRGLSETYSGGIGSYLLFVMIVGFLQQHNSTFKASRVDVNIGQLLVDFFQFYGYDFDVVNMGISIRGGGYLYRKTQRGFQREDRPELLSVESPLDPQVDVGRNSYNIPTIRDAFRKTYERLVVLHYLNEKGSIDCNDSILGAVIFVQDPLFSRDVLMKGLRTECQLYHELRTRNDCHYDHWLKPPNEKSNIVSDQIIAPYVSRIYNHSASRPHIGVSSQIMKETALHFNVFFEQLTQLKRIRRRFLKGKEKCLEKPTEFPPESDEYIRLLATVAKDNDKWNIAHSTFSGLNLEDEIGDNIELRG